MEAGRSGGALAGANQTQREKEVPAAIARLSRAIDNAEGALCGLNDRIQPVLSNAPPTPVNPNNVARGANAKIASAIIELTERVQRIADAANEVAARVEV